MEDYKLHYIEANGIRFAYFEQGKGPLVICLHGFPDTPLSFRSLIPVLAEQGYRVVAPYMRGYHPTSLAKDGDYTVEAMAADTLALIDAFGEESAIVLGHDWGSFAAYVAANEAPEKVSKLICCCAPHLGKVPFPFRQLLKSWYVLFFQLPGWPENAVAKNNFTFIERLYKNWSPTWQFSEADVEPVKKALTGGGRVKAAISYYRAMLKMSRRQWRLMTSEISIPTLILAGEVDGAIDIKLFGSIRDCFVGDLEFYAFPDTGHFPQREAPQLFNQKVSEFLAVE